MNRPLDFQFTETNYHNQQGFKGSRGPEFK
jgi:hypothetical protein